MGDRRIMVVFSAIEPHKSVAWDQEADEQVCRCGARMRSLRDYGIHRDTAILAALDADLADPDTEQRMLAGAARRETIYLRDTFRAALAAWRSEP